MHEALEIPALHFLLNLYAREMTWIQVAYQEQEGMPRYRLVFERRQASILNAICSPLISKDSRIIRFDVTALQTI